MSKKEQTHQRILESMHKTFRQYGYDGAGVNGLASGAGVTSGAFYAHFGSKPKAFREVVIGGVRQTEQAIQHFQDIHTQQWLDEFVAFYLGEKRCSELSDSCALQSLTPEVVRSGEETREVFQNELTKVVETFNQGKDVLDGDNDTNAWATLAMLIGGVTLARAVKDPALADEIANAVQQAVKKV
ncbi:TetR/AcrR family transcriptional regulator [Pseudoalteromonas obscura]|uniref:TetR/AcrR family transcriptional regulator n=1 Tax=Pseudoalteromonas obscura TaxID=3048491 RepID=A0ABT7ELR2_9GAMM|nr:TetR/AcrR family transcriptional regulator [Pseudoalteromonas sp. P94(2023)]MDK2595940.1 TetR/AcrR family transcriptional regulator [Pseudoalteromonas sp. P94(2023)]